MNVALKSREKKKNYTDHRLLLIKKKKVQSVPNGLTGTCISLPPHYSPKHLRVVGPKRSRRFNAPSFFFLGSALGLVSLVSDKKVLYPEKYRAQCVFSRLSSSLGLV